MNHDFSSASEICPRCGIRRPEAIYLGRMECEPPPRRVAVYDFDAIREERERIKREEGGDPPPGTLL